MSKIAYTIVVKREHDEEEYYVPHQGKKGTTHIDTLMSGSHQRPVQSQLIVKVSHIDDMGGLKDKFNPYKR